MRAITLLHRSEDCEVDDFKFRPARPQCTLELAALHEMHPIGALMHDSQKLRQACCMDLLQSTHASARAKRALEAGGVVIGEGLASDA